MPEKRPSVLISGASVAGPVLAYWLHRFGFRPTVIERTPEPRFGTGGHAVDLFGPAVELMGWMGVLSEVEQARTQTKVIALVRPHRRPVEAPAEMLSEGVAEQHIEIMRGDLARIFYEATRDDVAYVFDDSIATVQDDGQPDTGDVRTRGPPGASTSSSAPTDCIRSLGDWSSVQKRSSCDSSAATLRCLTCPTICSFRIACSVFSCRAGRPGSIRSVTKAKPERCSAPAHPSRLHDYDRHDSQAQRQLVRSLYRRSLLDGSCHGCWTSWT